MRTMIGALFFLLSPLFAHAAEPCRVVEFPERYEVSCTGLPGAQVAVPQAPAAQMPGAPLVQPPQEVLSGAGAATTPTVQSYQPPQMAPWSRHRRPNPADLEAARAERAKLITQDKQN
ncbi:hypothetical protein [Geomesophilobacter sediminis]|uniref:DUF4124 domain-containing protein n=1 Tax=Geomesophilobacter sediminis TaxID=2798584 RepID=A0A8J7M3N0_9BACT|nr:hypothetical protein [Geomesophilobacter sediminis]MBJ6727651.1 hypothetical protein [Geomesophilobacter sediminis]